MRVIGLTGGIGSGKSTVATMLEDLGAVIVDADTVGHEIYRPNSEGWKRVSEAFGTALLSPDGSIDRRKLGAIVFNDPEALQRLNAIVHPLMLDEIRRRIDSYEAAGVQTPVVLEAAVLIEAGWLTLVDEVWLVEASREAVVERVSKQRGLAAGEVSRRLQAQLSDDERRRYAHKIIHNTGSVDDLREKVRAAWTSAVVQAE